jgi:hypothetical protein
VQVTSNAAWTAAASADWVTVSLSSGSGDAEVSVTVAENPSTASDEATVIFATSGKSAALTIKRAEAAVVEEGVLPGAFSVSATKQVNFSQGNLQYQASTGIWRFAENQYDMIGAAAGNTTAEADRATQVGWIDLFGWGTSGYNDKYPYMTSTTSSDYGDGKNDIAGTDYDWGVYNAISNGGDKAGLWRTLTKDEWWYMFETRDGAYDKCSQGTVNDIHGLILLPDSWTLPSGLTFTANAKNWTTNVYSADNWAKMQTAGAVFIPAAGYRCGTDVGSVGDDGCYWSSSYYGASGAYYVNFVAYYVNADNNCLRCYGHSVRLAKDL